MTGMVEAFETAPTRPLVGGVTLDKPFTPDKRRIESTSQASGDALTQTNFRGAPEV